MNIDYLDEQDVHTHLTMSVCIDLMAETQAAISRGEITLPLRHALPLSAKNDSLLIMPGEITKQAVFGAKLISLFPNNSSRGRPVIQGGILLFDSNTGSALALVEAASITAIRTAAASGAATNVLANPTSHRLAILGCGVQATTHLEAMLEVRPIEEVRIWSRNLTKAETFVAEHSDHARITLCASPTVKEAVADADIVCTVTGAHQPILEGAWLKPGVHLNLVGAHSATSREVDGEAMRGAQIFTEISEFAWAEAGDILLAIEEGAINKANVVGEIGEVIEGKLPGRTNPADITVYKNLGNTAQDLAAAFYVYNKTRGAASAD